MQGITAAGIVLEPLTAGHAQAMFEILSDPLLYAHLDEAPPASADELRRVYARREVRRSPDGRQQWLNWVVRVPGQPPMGYVQATVTTPGVAWIAYVLASGQWGRGHAFTATRMMLDHLHTAYGVRQCLASVEADNARSIRLLGRLGFRAATVAEAAAHDLTPSVRLFLRQRAAAPPAL
jgi:ribosomal-protein-alanine N-acetyltransferase